MKALFNTDHLIFVGDGDFFVFVPSHFGQHFFVERAEVAQFALEILGASQMNQGIADAHHQIDIAIGQNIDLFDLVIPKFVVVHEVAEGEKVFPYILFVDISGDDGHIGFVALGQHAHTFVVYIVVFALLIHDAQ